MNSFNPILISFFLSYLPVLLVLSFFTYFLFSDFHLSLKWGQRNSRERVWKVMLIQWSCLLQYWMCHYGFFLDISHTKKFWVNTWEDPREKMNPKIWHKAINAKLYAKANSYVFNLLNNIDLPHLDEIAYLNLKCKVKIK